MEKSLSRGFVLRGAVEYSIVEPLHQGGFGITYRATANIMVGNIPQVGTFTIKEFFIGKICSRDSQGNVVVAAENQNIFRQAKRDFKDEAEILHSLKHSNIVPVNEVFEQNNTVYYVMSYLGTTSLYSYVQQQGGLLSETQALKIYSPLKSALDYLHECSVLHLDIKPDNIMMVMGEDTVKPVLIDFGQAIYFVNGKPRRNKGIGGYSKGYSPTELKQVVSSFSPLLDSYSLSATLLYMLSGTDPCDASELSVHKIYRLLPENISQKTIDMIFDGMGKGRGMGSDEFGHDAPIVTDPVIPSSSQSLPVGRIAVAAVAGVAALLLGWGGYQYHVHAADGMETQEEKNDTVVKDTVNVKNVATVNGSDSLAVKKQDSESSDSKDAFPATDTGKKPEAKEDTKKKEYRKISNSPTSGTVNLGYATWSGGLLNGKPHGVGTMKFRRSHAVDGCTATPEAGDYIEGFCKNGILQNGCLYRNGVKIESIVR